ncbi:hypothetical protein LSTR_LSTR009880 [Laodelphax striatellus]|uniref:3'-5' exonuclease domain-containing protein n=1 Tax=Laodelphax striatellus TaxID=195883 RepID=A0A482WHW4_LAOST|nr:hypothetical protein LSTR_LSTR009880 [Laodelphax striatellus]
MASRKLPEWMCKSKGKSQSQSQNKDIGNESQLLRFTGRIISIKDGDETSLNNEIGLLIQRIEAFHEEEGEKFPLGFDIEWPVDLRRRFFGKVSLMQICPDEILCYIIQLKKDLDKSEEVRLSDWGKNLTKQQTLYAATDAYASLLVYKHLKQVEEKNLETLARLKMRTSAQCHN